MTSNIKQSIDIEQLATDVPHPSPPKCAGTQLFPLTVFLTSTQRSLVKAKLKVFHKKRAEALLLALNIVDSSQNITDYE